MNPGSVHTKSFPGRCLVDGSWSWPGQTVVINSHMDQSHWVSMGDADLDDEFAGYEPDADDEDGGDAEADPAEFGFGDYDAISDPDRLLVE